jgi:hypothetical protein
MNTVINNITAEPTTTHGGTPVTVTVSLSAAAPEGGATVGINVEPVGHTTGPANLVIPAGHSSGQFVVNPKNTPATVVVHATYAGIKRHIVVPVTAGSVGAVPPLSTLASEPAPATAPAAPPTDWQKVPNTVIPHHGSKK